MECKKLREDAVIRPTSSRVLACATVIEEMLPLMPPQMSYEILDFGLHVKPNELKFTLQKAIDSAPANIDTFILGYGLCSRAVVGLQAKRGKLIIPRADDCIAIFLGSQSIYRRQQLQEPGTYYLTKGWLKAASTPFDEYDSLIKKYGREKANCIFRQILKNYTRLAFINTGPAELDNYRERVRKIADKFSLRLEEIQGSASLIKKMIYGPWDDEFVIASPGQTVSFMDFRKEAGSYV
jgi:hypothetical protein